MSVDTSRTVHLRVCCIIEHKQQYKTNIHYITYIWRHRVTCVEPVFNSTSGPSRSASSTTYPSTCTSVESLGRHETATEPGASSVTFSGPCGGRGKRAKGAGTRSGRSLSSGPLAPRTFTALTWTHARGFTQGVNILYNSNWMLVSLLVYSIVQNSIQ